MSLLRRRDKKEVSALERYRNGGDGFCDWCEENVRIPVYKTDSPIPSWVLIGDLSRDPVPGTGRSFWDMWCNQKSILREALQMKDGRLKHRLIVFCWPRGEGKSAVACLIQLWKFFCFPRQQIMLGANSKDQVKFVHFDIMRDIILNSPRLLEIVGRQYVQEKEIQLRDSSGNVGSLIRSISSFSGIVSNITGYSFSEMFDMKNPKFFVQLDGSTRNMPNSLGVIDSTVSEKSHILYKLYETYRKGKDPSLFFHYRFSEEGSYKDMWHPYNSQEQLDSYREKFPESEFRRYFLNLWEAAGARFFTPEMIKGIEYIGHNGTLGCQQQIMDTLSEFNKKKKGAMESGDGSSEHLRSLEVEVEKTLTPTSSVYQLESPGGHPRMCSIEELNKLADLYQTDFAIMAGVDRADPMKTDLTKGAKTIVTIVAKGLPNSRVNPDLYLEETTIKRYMYFILDIVHVESNELDGIKAAVLKAVNEYDGIETLCGERWGMWDIGSWCEDNNIMLEILQPTYDRQKEAFTELFLLFRQGFLKSPPIRVVGMKKDNILAEEAEIFDHNPAKKQYGSLEKIMKDGVQDDCVFSLAWCVFGGRKLTPLDFRQRSSNMTFGEMFTERTVGAY